MTSRRLALVVVGAGALVGVSLWMAYRGPPAPNVRVPALSADGRAGQVAFQRHCASCHGDVAQGTATGPPLVHAIYRPGHHADVAFELAVRHGSRVHHWRFGDMPPLPTSRGFRWSEVTSRDGSTGDGGPIAWRRF